MSSGVPAAPIPIDLDHIRREADAKAEENAVFRDFLRRRDGAEIDRLVHQLDGEITPRVDCTACGNCCKSLIIHTEPEENERVAARMGMPLAQWEETYLERSMGGKTVLNQIPCHFLTGTRCSVYEDRFSDCREFPHLHRDHFTERLFSTMMYYGVCPILYHVVERLKAGTGFFHQL
jgi:Fe-S-cluster containining protein